MFKWELALYHLEKQSILWQSKYVREVVCQHEARQKMLWIWEALHTVSSFVQVFLRVREQDWSLWLTIYKMPMMLLFQLLQRSIGRLYPLAVAKHFEIPDGMCSINVKYALVIPFLKLSSDLRSRRLSHKKNAAKMNKQIFMFFTRPKNQREFILFRFCQIFVLFKVQLIQISQKSVYKQLQMS